MASKGEAAAGAVVAGGRRAGGGEEGRAGEAGLVLGEPGGYGGRCLWL